MTTTVDSFTTPVRAAHELNPKGATFLREVECDYLDGAESRVLEILRECTDISSLSDEPLSHATNWPERYDLSPVRSNVVRPFQIPSHARVLEIGAGCGAVTRYLGEIAEVVDALEPVPERARCAAERTRDLQSVNVFIGEIDDIPAAPAYDIVVVVGVLEYVGNGATDDQPYLAFLHAISERLVDGGSLVLAIENKLGVKYLVGAPEDHTHRVFDSLENYPHGSHVRTFDRRSLTALMAAAGLQAETAVAFPDYKMTRAVFRPDIATPETESLLHRVPNFPSPDWGTPRETLADERLVWRSLVQAGLAADAGNSFVIVAGKGAASNLWPTDVAGFYYSAGRKRAFVTETRIDVSGRPMMCRRRLSAEPLTGEHTLVVGDCPVVPGEDLIDLLVDADDARTIDYLNRWVDMVDVAASSAADGRPPMDLLPHNLVVNDAGDLEFIDDEWRAESASREMVIRRGVLFVGIKLAEGGRPRGQWSGCLTIADAVKALGSAVGLPADGSWIATTIQDEAALQVAVTSWPRGDSGVVVGAIESFLHRDLHSPFDLDCRMRVLRDSVREGEQIRMKFTAVESELAAARADLVAARLAMDDHAQRLIAMDHHADLLAERERRASADAEQIRQTVSWRVTAPLRSARRASARMNRVRDRETG